MTNPDQEDTFNHVDEILSLGRGSLLEVLEGFEVSAMSYLGTEVTKLLPAGTQIRTTREVSEETLAIKGLAALEEVSLRVTIPVEQWHLLKVTKKVEKEKRDEGQDANAHVVSGYRVDNKPGDTSRGPRLSSTSNS